MASISRRHALAASAATVLLAFCGTANAAEMIRVGLPTKTYWPTTIAETAVRQKLFEKEGIQAELTIYRSGAETFEAWLRARPTSFSTTVAGVRRTQEGRDVEIVANAAMGNFGWQLMVPTKSTLDVKDLNGKKVAITRPAPAPTCSRCGPFQQEDRFYPRSGRGGGLVPTCSPAMSRRRWSIRR